MQIAIVRASAALLALVLGAPAAAADQTANGGISTSALQQIQALTADKLQRTPTQQKISSQLLYAAKLRHGQLAASGVSNFHAAVAAQADGTTIVDIRANADAASAIAALGVQVIEISAEHRSIRASVSLDRLEDIASLDSVFFIQPDPKGYHNRVLTMRDGMPATFPMRGTAQAMTAQRRQQIAANMRQALTNNIPNGYTATGAVSSEGVITHGAYSARGAFNTTGSGIRIGVLSDGATSYADSQASGDLPPTCAPAPPSTPASQACFYPIHNHSGDEGTAMAEIIHDIAPGAQIYFSTGDTSITGFANSIRELRNTYHCDIIVDDLSYYVESVFQDGQAAAIVSSTNGGVVTQAVNDVVAAGALYFSSAANSGNLDAGTSGTYEGDFNSGGTNALLSGGTVHNFGGGQLYDVLTGGNGSGSGDFPSYSLMWSDPLGAASNDYDLYVLDSTGSFVITGSNDVQSGTQDPYEAVAYDADIYPNARFVVFKHNGAAIRYFHIDTNRGTLSIGTSGSTHGHNAASSAYGVAAAPAFMPSFLPDPPTYGPYPSTFSTTSTIEPFSSDGPRRVFFNGAGSAFTPGNLTSTGGKLLQQPFIAAADGVAVTGAGGFENPFFGTSAAAPHAAAITALLRSAKPTLTAAQIKTALISSAVDVAAAGTDRDSGVGIVMPVAALQAAGATGKAFLETSAISALDAHGNNDGIIEPGEDGKFTIRLKNTGTATASAISATLSTTVKGISVVYPTSTYLTLVPEASAANSTSLQFHVAGNSTHIDQTIPFTLTVTYTGGWHATQTMPITLQIGGTRRTIQTTFDATAPTPNASFPTTVGGNQIATLYPTSWSEDCSVVKPMPGTTGSGARRFESYTLVNKTGKDACMTVTVTFDKTATDYLDVAAYEGTFHGSNLFNDTFLGDAGYPYATVTRLFRTIVPKDATVNIVVNEYSFSGSGFGTPYTLEVLGLGDDRIFFDKFD